MDRPWLWLGLLGLLVVGTGTAVRMSRGVRNNNLLNIKYHPSNAWIGQIGSDGTFSVFSKPEYSVRAAKKILHAYRVRGVKTLSQIVNTFAPENENNPSAYISFLVEKTGFLPHTVITDDKIPRLLHAMAEFETGTKINPSIIEKGVSLA